ncbi:unnamed protein product, partial [Amoebophrya sp. A25]|eukprot:GSA25T00018201001.1
MSLGAEAFDVPGDASSSKEVGKPSSTTSRLRGIFESERIQKVLFDCRQDVEALFFHFGVLPRNVYDLQISYLLSDKQNGTRHLKGLPKALQHFFEHQACAGEGNGQTSGGEEQRLGDVFASLKVQGKALYEPRMGGRYEVWGERP